MFLLQILFEGEIILPAPSWVSYAPQAIIGRNKIKWIQTKSENNWFPTAKEIEDVIKKDKQKKYLIFLNSPNNPSGQVCTNLSEISQLTKKYNLYFLSDEIYSELTFEDNYQSISNYSPENTIISTGLSKWCGAGGWRLGYFILPENLSEITNQLKVLASETFSSVSSPIQYAAIAAHKNDHTNYINHSKNILKVLKEARKKKIYSVSFLGKGGGKAKKLSNKSRFLDCIIKDANLPYGGSFLYSLPSDSACINLVILPVCIAFITL